MTHKEWRNKVYRAMPTSNEASTKWHRSRQPIDSNKGGNQKWR